MGSADSNKRSRSLVRMRSRPRTFPFFPLLYINKSYTYIYTHIFIHKIYIYVYMYTCPSIFCTTYDYYPTLPRTCCGCIVTLDCCFHQCGAFRFDLIRVSCAIARETLSTAEVADTAAPRISDSLVCFPLSALSSFTPFLSFAAFAFHEIFISSSTPARLPTDPSHSRLYPRNYLDEINELGGRSFNQSDGNEPRGSEEPRADDAG